MNTQEIAALRRPRKQDILAFQIIIATFLLDWAFDMTLLSYGTTENSATLYPFILAEVDFKLLYARILV